MMLPAALVLFCVYITKPCVTYIENECAHLEFFSDWLLQILTN